MPEQPQDLFSVSEVQPSSLPALLPSTSIVLKRTQTAVGLLHNMVQESSAEYWYKRGKDANKKEEWNEANYSFNQCINLEAKHWRGALQLASVTAQQQVDGTEKYFNRAYDNYFNEDFIDELNNIQWQNIKNYFELQKQIENKSFDILLALAIFYWFTDDNNQARQMLDDAKYLYIEQINQCYSWRRLSGSLWEKEENDANALIEFDYAVNLAPNDFRAYCNRAGAKSYLGDYEGTITDYDRAIEIRPNDAELYLSRANSKSLKDTANALADYEHALHLANENNLADLVELIYENVIMLKARVGDFKGALYDCNKLISIHPEDGSNYYTRGNIKEELNDLYGAILDYNYTLEWNPEFRSCYVSRGDIKYKIQDYNGALEDYTSAIPFANEYESFQRELYFKLGNTRFQLHNDVDSLSDYNVTIKFNPGYSEAYIKRALVKERLGDLSGATSDRQYASALESRADKNNE